MDNKSIGTMININRDMIQKRREVMEECAKIIDKCGEHIKTLESLLSQQSPPDSNGLYNA